MAIFVNELARKHETAKGLQSTCPVKFHKNPFSGCRREVKISRPIRGQDGHLCWQNFWKQKPCKRCRQLIEFILLTFYVTSVIFQHLEGLWWPSGLGRWVIYLYRPVQITVAFHLYSVGSNLARGICKNDRVCSTSTDMWESCQLLAAGRWFPPGLPGFLQQ